MAQVAMEIQEAADHSRNIGEKAIPHFGQKAQIFSFNIIILLLLCNAIEELRRGERNYLYRTRANELLY
jgi:hypothetical protein